MPFKIHPSGLCTWFDASNQPEPGKGGRQAFGKFRSRRSVFFNRASILWYKYPKLNFFTFTLKEQNNVDTFYTGKFSMLLENYRQRFKRNSPDGFENYVWVAEVQKRGAIHFHLLTHAYVPIKGLQNYWNDLVEQTSRNSVDVQHVPDSINSVPAYMCKYFTKQTYRTKSGLLKSLRTLECRSFGSSAGLKFDSVTLEAPPGKPLSTFTKIIERNGERVEVDFSYYNTRFIIDNFFPEAATTERCTLGFISPHATPTKKV